MKRPKKVTKLVVCSLCGLEWERHGDDPDALKCIELLKAELAKRPTWPHFSGNPVESMSLRGIPINKGDDVGKAH